MLKIWGHTGGVIRKREKHEENKSTGAMKEHDSRKQCVWVCWGHRNDETEVMVLLPGDEEVNWVQCQGKKADRWGTGWG